MRTVIASALLFTLACASGSSSDRPASIAQPEISVRQAGPIFFGSSSTAGVSIDVQVTNRADVPLVVREVEVSSPGMTQYTIERGRKLFNVTVPPGETKTVGLVATAVARQTQTPTSEPLIVRAFVRLEAGGKSFREVVVDQFSALP